MTEERRTWRVLAQDVTGWHELHVEAATAEVNTAGALVLTTRWKGQTALVLALAPGAWRRVERQNGGPHG